MIYKNKGTYSNSLESVIVYWLDAVLQKRNNGFDSRLHRKCALFIGVWCNGSMPVSKTVDGSSNLSTPATSTSSITLF